MDRQKVRKEKRRETKCQRPSDGGRHGNTGAVSVQSVFSQCSRYVLFSVGERARHGKKMNQTNDGTKSNGSGGGRRVKTTSE